MFEVSVRNRLGDFLLDVAFEGPGDGVTTLFGPSGAGKSATLAAIGGTAAPDAARIAVNGRVLIDTARAIGIAPPHRRIGWVYQDARLFPHMPVRDNLLYGLRRARGRRTIGTADVIDMLAIGHLLDRRVAELSGGERQRVALGRALLSQPDLLLLDEPLAALDEPRRREILGFIARLNAEFRLPMLYVTHSALEVCALADHVVCLEGGKVIRAGAPADILESLGGDQDRIEAVVTGREMAGGLEAITDDGRRFTVPLARGAPGDRVTVTVTSGTLRAESPDFHLRPLGTIAEI